MSYQFTRPGRLVQHGAADRLGRADAIEFQGRADRAQPDWLAEVRLSVSAWPTRAGVAVILEQQNGDWVPVASSLPFDGLYLRAETEIHIVFGVYVPIQPDGVYRLHLPAAVLTRPSLRIGARGEALADAGAPRRRTQPASPARRAS